MSSLSRRGLITGLIAFVAAPAIVRVGSLMPVKAMTPTLPAWDDGIDKLRLLGWEEFTMRKKFIYRVMTGEMVQVSGWEPATTAP